MEKQIIGIGDGKGQFLSICHVEPEGCEEIVVCLTSHDDLSTSSMNLLKWQITDLIYQLTKALEEL